MKKQQQKTDESNSKHQGKALPESSMLPLWRKINSAFLARFQFWSLPVHSAIVLLYLQSFPENDEPGILADQTSLPRQTMTSALDALEREGLATREPHKSDRRRKRIVLTPEGERRASEMVAELLAFEAAGICHIPVADRKRMLKFLTSYSEALDIENKRLVSEMKEV